VIEFKVDELLSFLPKQGAQPYFVQQVAGHMMGNRHHIQCLVPPNILLFTVV